MNTPQETYPDTEAREGALREPARTGRGPEWETAPRRPARYDETARKSPVLAALMSGFPGLGQIYVGYYPQGFFNALLVATLITVLNMRGGDEMQPLAGFFLAFFWLYNIVDAARRAALYNQMLAGLPPDQLPETVKMPSGQGTMVGGIVLVFFGLLLFAHTMFGMSLEWIEDWWPLALVGLGAYLIYAAKKSQ